MTTSIVPTVPDLRLRTGGDRKYHTIHIDSRIFTVQKNGTSVLAFRKKNDVLRFSKLIESHYELTNEWPVINFEDSLLFRNTRTNRLKYVNIVEWSGEQLSDWCIRNVFGVLDIDKFEGDNKLVGRAISWDIDGDFYREFLNEKLYL